MFVGRVNAYFGGSFHFQCSYVEFVHCKSQNKVFQASVHGNGFEGYLSRRHSVSELVVHLIFTTKYRRKIFDSMMIQQIREALQSAAEKLEIEILEMDGEADHIHILIAYPPKLSISVLVNNLKLISSRRVRILNTHLRKVSNSSVL